MSNFVLHPAPLVVFPGALGDFICLLPALGALEARASRRPTLFCKGDLVPLANAAAVADAQPIEDRRTSWLFSAHPLEEADRFFGAFASIDSFTGAGVPEVMRNLSRWQGTNGRAHAFRPAKDMHLAVHFLRALDPGAQCDIPSEVHLSLDARACDQRFAPFAAARPLLVVHPGSGGRVKRWSRAGFVEVARRWRDRRGAVIVVLGPAERDEASYWQKDFVVAADVDLVTAASLLARCDAYLGNDSGMSHLAAAAGARGVALFGPTDPQCWRPLSARIESIRLDPWIECDRPASHDAVDRVARALDDAAESP